MSRRERYESKRGYREQAGHNRQDERLGRSCSVGGSSQACSAAARGERPASSWLRCPLGGLSIPHPLADCPQLFDFTPVQAPCQCAVWAPACTATSACPISKSTFSNPHGSFLLIIFPLLLTAFSPFLEIPISHKRHPHIPPQARSEPLSRVRTDRAGPGPAESQSGHQKAFSGQKTPPKRGVL